MPFEMLVITRKLFMTRICIKKRRESSGGEYDKTYGISVKMYNIQNFLRREVNTEDVISLN